MSTLKVAAINNPSASSGGLAISASGNVTGAGLDLITTQSFSAVSSVSVNNCFSATYDNYRVIYRMTAISATNADVWMRLRASMTDSSGSSYGYQRVLASGTTLQTDRDAAGQTVWYFGQGATSAGQYCGGVMDIQSPAIAVPTLQVSQMHIYTSTNLFYGAMAGYHAASTSYDGFSLLPVSGTFTGSVSVYGYRK